MGTPLTSKSGPAVIFTAALLLIVGVPLPDSGDSDGVEGGVKDWLSARSEDDLYVGCDHRDRGGGGGAQGDGDMPMY